MLKGEPIAFLRLFITSCFGAGVLFGEVIEGCSSALGCLYATLLAAPPSFLLARSRGDITFLVFSGCYLGEDTPPNWYPERGLRAYLVAC